MTDFADARKKMVENQLRTSAITDRRLLAVMAQIPRERFVPAERQPLAYIDEAHRLPSSGEPRYLAPPAPFARLVQLAAIESDDRVLDVGCGTGYSSAVLARLGASVVALEQDADLLRAASELLANVVGKVELVQGGLIEGVKAQGPYDVIFVNGAVEQAPDTLLAQLAEGGRLVTVMRDGTQARAWLFVKESGQVGRRPDFDADVPLLAGFKKAMGFVF